MEIICGYLFDKYISHIKWFIKLDPNKSINPDEAFAYGASILAVKLSSLENKDINNILIKDITQFR